MPGTHRRASRFQLRSTDAGTTARAGQRVRAFSRMATSTWGVLPQPGASASSTRQLCSARKATPSRWNGRRSGGGPVGSTGASRFTFLRRAGLRRLREGLGALAQRFARFIRAMGTSPLPS